MVVILLLWNGMSIILKRFSERMDTPDGNKTAKGAVGFSAICLILFSLTLCIGAFDWMMSTEPHWFSTIYGVGVFSGTFVSGMAFITLAVIKLQDWGYLKGAVTDDHLHDLGKWMFGMSVFWAYIWVSQYILIWYANIPEETEYYVLRHHEWNFVFFANLFINFFVPFFALMTRKAKRNRKVLTTVACILLVGHFVDIYLMVAPKVFEHHGITSIQGGGALQLLQLIGGLGFFVFITGTALSKRKLLVNNDPTFDEGVHLHQ